MRVFRSISAGRLAWPHRGCTIAFAMLDRLVHNCHRIGLRRGAMRKLKARRDGEGSDLGLLGVRILTSDDPAGQDKPAVTVGEEASDSGSPVHAV